MLLSLQDLFNREWCKLEPSSFVELVLELNPVEPERMQECLHEVHHHQHSQREGNESEESEEELNEGPSLQSTLDCVIEEDLSQLGVSQRESPETQVTGSVGHSSQHELNGLNQLMDEDVRE